jgi:hypothetical protein
MDGIPLPPVQPRQNGIETSEEAAEWALEETHIDDRLSLSYDHDVSKIIPFGH